MMGTQTLPKLPVVDFTKENLKPGTSFWQLTSDEVLRALEQYGCFVAVCDKIPKELHNTMLESMEGLFHLPEEKKLQVSANGPGVSYFGPGPSLPLIEAFTFENATTLEGTQRFTNVMWPAGNDGFCETAFLFSKLLEEMVETVQRMVFEGYGLEKYLDSHVASTTYKMGFVKQTPPKMNEINKGGKPHSDKSFLTILDQNQVKGLEIETEGQWIAFEPAPSQFLVIAGDAFMAWSNGRIHAPSHVHGVTTHGKEVNYSVNLISFMRNMVQAPEELVDNQHPLLFKPFSNLGFLQYWIEEVEKNPKCSLKDYCGV